MFIRDSFISRLAFICACYFFAAAIIIHFIRSDLDLISSTLSYYALGQHGIILQAGFVAIGISQLLLAWLVLSCCCDRRPVTGALFLALSGLGVLLVAVFPVQPPEAGLAARLPHVVGAIMQFLFFPVALLWLAPMMITGKMRNYTLITGMFTAIVFVILLALFIIRQNTAVPVFGLIEKLDITIITLWILVAAYILKRPACAARLFGDNQKRQGSSD